MYLLFLSLTARAKVYFKNCFKLSNGTLIFITYEIKESFK